MAAIRAAFAAAILRLRHVALLAVLWEAAVTWASSLVGPGAVGSYQGGGGGRRYGGAVQVNEPPVGFFVGGSSIRGMNGLYARSQSFPHDVDHEFVFYYEHDITGWILALVAAPEEVRRSKGHRTEWMLIDPDKDDRFRANGDTLIPAAGRTWSHIHRTKSAEPDPKAGQAVAAAAEEDDEEELPWQVIGVGSADMMRTLRRHFQFYKHQVQQAIAGHNLPALPGGWGSSAEQSPPPSFETPAILAAAEAGEAAGRDTCSEESTDIQSAEAALAAARSSGTEWAKAALHLRISSCHRRARDFRKAHLSLQDALDLFPRYTAALEEKGKLYLDEGLVDTAIIAFETLLRVDRNWPSVDAWLVRAGTQKRREEGFGNKPELKAKEDSWCIAWRQTGGCSPTGPREASQDRPCDEIIEKGSSGFCHCKGSGARGATGTAPATAAESTCEHHPFTCSIACKERHQLETGELQWVPQLTPQQKELAAEVARTAESSPCSMPGEAGLPDWCSPNHYRILAVRCDFPDHVADEGDAAKKESEELKRAYKRRSLQFHPDKRGGSAQAFQRVAEANQILSDSEKRRAFDEGDDFPRKRHQDNSEAETNKEEIIKKYFPERFDFAPFGDPHSDRREAADYERKKLERRKQEALAREAAKQERKQDRIEL